MITDFGNHGLHFMCARGANTGIEGGMLPAGHHTDLAVG